MWPLSGSSIDGCLRSPFSDPTISALFQEVTTDGRSQEVTDEHRHGGAAASVPGKRPRGRPRATPVEDLLPAGSIMAASLLSRAGRLKKDPLSPKQPRSAYFHFLGEHRAAELKGRPPPLIVAGSLRHEKDGRQPACGEGEVEVTHRLGAAPSGEMPQARVQGGAQAHAY